MQEIITKTCKIRLNILFLKSLFTATIKNIEKRRMRTFINTIENKFLSPVLIYCRYHENSGLHFLKF